MLRSMTIATAVVAAMGSATAASAVTYNVTQAGVFFNGSVDLNGTISGNPFSKTEITGPIVLKGVTSAGKSFEVVTFCIDLFHNISVGIGGFSGVNYTYTLAPITTDLSDNPGGSSFGGGNLLSTAQIEKISGLANLGRYIYASSLSNKQARLDAISAAIWTTEYGVTATNFIPLNALGYYNTYLGKSFAGAKGQALIASDASGALIGNLQGLAVGGVPEPETWALMILGFGLVGIGARRSVALRVVA